ncbi:hypothetical protein SAMN04244570_0547 [Sporosarcina newyorkensis]|uniref:Uncharacterized protein n=1 Tax=Sporosarcina newyorkensis TaxID=759851 RepID=A0A1T4XDN4_9BACL|nr:hypothetical protein SAMN04244570_0547 [Sporosarcina newyorkensis]
MMNCVVLDERLGKWLVHRQYADAVAPADVIHVDLIRVCIMKMGEDLVGPFLPVVCVLSELHEITTLFLEFPTA